MPHLVAAPDKFRGTAEAAEVAAAVAQAAGEAGWTADTAPCPTAARACSMPSAATPAHRAWPDPWASPPGPNGACCAAPDATRSEAVIEMSQAAGRALLPHPAGDDPLRADTAGVGQLLLAARDAGATRIIIGCGGSATTDGGWGAVKAVGGPARRWPASSWWWPAT